MKANQECKEVLEAQKKPELSPATINSPLNLYLHPGFELHDEVVIECSHDVDLDVICKQMGRSSDWMPDILLCADGYETDWYRKD